MKIKRYMAVSMREALAQVRKEQGPDAVILSSRRVEEGIEVIAAVDYDEALFADATRPRATAAVADAPAPKAAAPAAEVPPPQVARPADVPAPRAAAPAARSNASAASVTLSPAPAAATPFDALRAAMTEDGAQPEMRGLVGDGEPAPATRLRAAADAAPERIDAPPAADAGYMEMQRELKELRTLLESGLAGMSWNDQRMCEPLRARVLEELSAMDIAPDVAMELAALTPQRTNLENPSHIPMALLVKHLPVVDRSDTFNSGIIAVVGPTGAGKTTTIAKLAARWRLEHGSEDLALVSTDGYRIGAREQLKTYAALLGVPMHVADNGKELAQVLERLKSKKLILIDTAGMGPRDERMREQLAALQLGAAGARVLLALPAQGEGHALDETVRAFARLAPCACVLTKVDEAASLGAVISATLRHRLKIAYVCDGQRVPEDLHPGHQRRIWLVSAAAKLKEHAPPRGNDGYYARNFGRSSAHV